VCNASTAHLFRADPPAGHYELIRSFEHPEGHARAADLVTDVPGRKPVGGSRGEGAGSRQGGFHGRPGAEPDTGPREVEARKFARTLAAVLDHALDEHAYEALWLVAPPRFLGLVKAELGDQAQKRLDQTMDKDLAWLDPREIVRRMRKASAP
jgi:protein required for attachment to host cells